MSAYPCPVVVGVAIVGGGAAGTLAAIQLLRRATAGTTIALVEPRMPLAQGVAYATRWPEHLLNVPAGKMSAFPDAPDDFLDYLMAQPGFADAERAQVAGRYVPRLHYAAYLQQRLEQARAASPAELRVINARVEAIQRDPAGVVLTLDNGAAFQACGVVLALGNSLRPLPAPGASQLSATQLVQAWDFDAVKAIDADTAVCIVGSGLSMADCIVSLRANGHRGQIHAISRHALLPLPHGYGAPEAFDEQVLMGLSLRQRVRLLRELVADAQSRQQPWQMVMDRLRPHGQALWLSLSEADQRRFLRHVVRYWDVHRHRIAGQVHAQLQDMCQHGQLQVHRGRLEAVSVVEGGVQVAARSADGQPLALRVGCIINATGVEMRAASMRNDLLQQLFQTGLAAPGPHGIGIDTDVDGSLLAADGSTVASIQVIGSLRIGRLWESLAIPELRQQAQVAAQRLLD